MGFLFLGLVILKSCEGQWQKLVTYKQRSGAVSPLYVAMRWQFTRWYQLVCPLHLSFYPLTRCFILFSSSPPSARSTSSVPPLFCADELNRVSELVPYGATLCCSDAEESTFGFKSSSQGSYTALIPLCMYSCKVLCVPVMCFAATADSSQKLIYTVERKSNQTAEPKTFPAWNTVRM